MRAHAWTQPYFGGIQCLKKQEKLRENTHCKWEEFAGIIFRAFYVFYLNIFISSAMLVSLVQYQFTKQAAVILIYYRSAFPSHTLRTPRYFQLYFHLVEEHILNLLSLALTWTLKKNKIKRREKLAVATRKWCQNLQSKAKECPSGADFPLSMQRSSASLCF